MNRKRCVSGIAAAAAFALFLVLGQGADAGEQKEYVSKAKATKLLKTSIAGASGKELSIVRFVAPGGFTGGRHSHPGQVFVYILEGSVNMMMDGKPALTLSAGQVFEEPTGNVMQVRNSSSGDAMKLLVFQIGDKGKPLMIKEK